MSMPQAGNANPSSGARGPLPLPALFDSLGDDAKAQLRDRGQLVELAAGDVLIAQGQVVTNLYVIEEGLLHAEVSDRHGLAVQVATLAPGDIFGEMSFLRSEHATATMRAGTRSAVLAIPHALLERIAEQYPAVLRELGKAVASKLGEANQRLQRTRTGRAVALAGIDSEWTAAAAAQIALSCARHLRETVVILDLGTIATEAPFIRQLPEFGNALSVSAGAATKHDRSDEPEVVATRGRPEMAREPRIIPLLSDLRRRFGLVIILLDALPDGHSADPLFGELDMPVIALRPEQGAKPSRAHGTRLQTILLRRGSQAPLPAALTTLSAQLGTEVIRAIPGDLARLRGEPAERPQDEPWASIGWVARHLIGRKVGLAFGAGSSKGYAHLGVYDELRRMGVPVDYVAGCSIGAPVAAAVARGIPMEETKIAIDETFASALRPTIPISSFLSSRRLRHRLDRIIQGLSFEDLATPLAIVAADLERRTEFVFREGSVLTAVMASMAIPGVFPAVQFEGRSLVDGAVLNPIPNATVAMMGADVVIGVRLTATSAPRSAPHGRFRVFRSPPIIETIVMAFEVMQWKIAAETAIRADVTIEPKFEGFTGLRDFTRGQEFIEMGREAAARARPALREHLAWLE